MAQYALAGRSMIARQTSAFAAIEFNPDYTPASPNARTHLTGTRLLSPPYSRSRFQAEPARRYSPGWLGRTRLPGSYTGRRPPSLPRVSHYQTDPRRYRSESGTGDRAAH